MKQTADGLGPPIRQRLAFGAKEVNFENPIPIERFTVRAWIEASHFFEHGDALDRWRAEIRDHLGVGDDLRNAIEIQRTIEAALGVAADARDSKDLPASKAWALSAFACHDAELRELMTLRSGPMAEVVEAAISKKLILLGRIVEWWQWRSLGLDRMAVAKREAIQRIAGPENEGRRVHNARRQKKAEVLYARIRDIAATLSSSRGALVRDIKKRLGDESPSDSTIQRALGIKK